ncbi:hypothetical protein MARINOS108_10858 [Marinoscillum sp. 108]|nr:hypothetical protein MARINOS108_10858 [Marinoscillum sp. 108]
MQFFAVWTGLEPATSCVTGRHSNQLNYHTVCSIALQNYTLTSSNATLHFKYFKCVFQFG